MKHGVTPERYAQLLAAGCAICQAQPGVLQFDHDHMTGVFRGLLCHGCNTGLGLFKDNAASLRAAADYLEERK